MIRMPPRLLACMAAILLLLAGVVGCGDHTETSDGSSRTDACPTDPVTVVVSVAPWRDLVEQLGGECAAVTTVVAGGATDPHDYEPTPADTARFDQAQLVVVNGLGYDEWAQKAVDALDHRPAVIDVGKLTKRRLGDNPHLWYDPDAVAKLSDAVTAELERLAPGAVDVFEKRTAAWGAEKAPYLEAIRSLVGEVAAAPAGSATYAASESVFDYMATAVGMTDLTPTGYRTAVANGSDPSPADIASFNKVLESGRTAVFVFNPQTAGSGPDEIRKVATSSRVEMVAISESSADRFVTWQVAQLQQMRAALERARLAE